MPKLIMTSEQAKDRAAWLAARNKGIGGSDIAVIMGVNKWKSAFALWREKSGQVEPEDLSDNERVYWGATLEDVVAQEFSLRTGKHVRRRGMLADDEFPFMLANVDRMIDGEEAGLECKTANGFAAKDWDGDELPDAYYLQCQWYMMITGFQKWYIAVLIGGNHFVHKEIPRCDEDIAAMRTAAIEFWRKVESGEMPELDGSDNCAKEILKKYPSAVPKKTVQLDDEAAILAGEIMQNKALAKDLDAAITLKENKLKEKLGDAEIGFAGERKITWTNRAGTSRLDSKRLQAEKPEVYKEYLKAGTPTRVLKIS